MYDVQRMSNNNKSCILHTVVLCMPRTLRQHVAGFCYFFQQFSWQALVVGLRILSYKHSEELDKPKIRPKKINCQLLRHRRVCFFTAALIVFTWGTKNCVRFRSFPVQSVSLLITIIVSKAFMLKACMVVTGISCHCI